MEARSNGSKARDNGSKASERARAREREREREMIREREIIMNDTPFMLCLSNHRQEELNESAREQGGGGRGGGRGRGGGGEGEGEGQLLHGAATMYPRHKAQVCQCLQA
jgi:hypothetical protein